MIISSLNGQEATTHTELEATIEKALTGLENGDVPRDSISLVLAALIDARFEVRGKPSIPRFRLAQRLRTR